MEYELNRFHKFDKKMFIQEIEEKEKNDSICTVFNCLKNF